MAICEGWRPRRSRSFPRRTRWPSNLGVVALNSVLLQAIVPAGAVGFAILCASHGWGVMSSARIPYWIAFAASMLLLDFAIYLQHVIFHAVPILWRFHRMHHTDLDFDVTTGVRFHPVEILISFGIKAGVIAALGAPAAAVLSFEVLLNATSMFNHGDVDIGSYADSLLRLVVVTPDMHRVHHSILVAETNSNFGFNLPWWDRLFGTYRAQPAAGHRRMTIGIEQFRDARELWLDRMLTQPFRRSVGAYPGRAQIGPQPGY